MEELELNSDFLMRCLVSSSFNYFILRFSQENDTDFLRESRHGNTKEFADEVLDK